MTIAQLLAAACLALIFALTVAVSLAMNAVQRARRYEDALRRIADPDWCAAPEAMRHKARCALRLAGRL